MAAAAGLAASTGCSKPSGDDPSPTTTDATQPATDTPATKPAAGPTIVRVVRSEAVAGPEGQLTYYATILREALDRTVEEYGPYEMTLFAPTMEQERSLFSLRENLIDVTWTMTSKERESDHRAIHIPLLAGLLGHRLLVVRDKKEAAFAPVSSAGDLATFKAVQGSEWPDVSVLEHNGLPVVTDESFDNLYPILQRGEADYFPRGVTEAWGEVEMHEDVSVEPTLLLRYPAAVYFFTRKDDALADRLETGLRAMVTDGTLRRMLDERYGSVLERGRLERRRVIDLENPGAPDSMPLQDDALWYRVKGRD